MAINEQKIRNVGSREIYDSYMGILRISPNDYNGEMVDDTTVFLQTFKTDASTDNVIQLSDSDGNRLAFNLIPKARNATVVNNTTGAKVSAQVVNVTLQIDRGGTYASNSLHVRSTLRVNQTRQTNKVSPLQIFTKNRTTGYNVLAYPIESPNDDGYFNSKNKLSLVNYTSSVPLHEQLEANLKTKSLDWYKTNINESEIVKIDGKVVYTVNNMSESVPVLYTRDYALGHYTGHSTYTTEKIRTNILGTPPTPVQTVDGATITTRLSYMRLDKMVWNKVAQLVSGQKRHTKGRYTQMGADESYDMTPILFEENTSVTDTSPIIGTPVPEGGVFYTAMPINRFLFHCMRSEIRNMIDETNSNNSITSTYRTYVNNGWVTPAKSAEKGWQSQLVRGYALCDGKVINYDNYKALSTRNGNIYQLDNKGNTVRNASGKPQLATPTGVMAAVKLSNAKGQLETPSLLAFDNIAMRYMRGLNWISDVGVDRPVNMNTDIKAGMFKDNNYDIEVIPGSGMASVKKNLKETGAYRIMYDFKIRNQQHTHYCFASTSGEAVAPGGDSSYVYAYVSWEKRCRTRIWFGRGCQGTYYVKIYHTEYKKLDPSLLANVTMNTNEPNARTEPNTVPTYDDQYWNDNMTYSFSKVRKEIGGMTQTQMYLYGATPLRMAALAAWRIQSDGTCKNEFEQRIAAGDFYIQDSELTPIPLNKAERKKLLSKMNEAEGKAPISIKGTMGAMINDFCSQSCKYHKGFSHTYHDSWSLSSATNGYEAMRFDEEAMGNYPYVKRCVTSLPLGELGTLGEHVEIEHKWEKEYGKKEVEIGDTTLTMDETLSEPPSMNFLPLFKV